ncbi:MAG: MATE family efflux transporter [Ruminococcus sp.]|nr:MATE family efflux transporter [Ruminococcus sp.]
MEKVQQKENKMGTMPMTKLILTMSLPAIFSMTILAMYNVVDSIFVSKYDMDGFTAISLAYPLQLLLIAASVGTAVGVNSLVSRKLGEQNYEQANAAATHGLVLCLFTYAFFLLLGIFGVRPFMTAFSGGNERVVEAGVQYFTCVLCLSLFSIIQVMIEKTLQATGNMIYPMLFQLTGAVVNIIFDPLLIFGIWIFPEMGVLGAAVATVFGQFCGMVFAVIILFCKSHRVQIKLKGFRFNPITVKNIYAVGFPSIIMQSIGAIMMLGLNAIFQAYHSIVAVDVFGIYFKLQSFVFMPCFGLNQGLMPILGYNYGARNRARLYSALKRGVLIAGGIMLAGTILMWTIPDVLLSMFGDESSFTDVDPQTLLREGEHAFRIISLCFVPAAVGIVFTTLFQAVGKGFRSLLMSFFRQLLILLPTAFLLAMTAGVTNSWYAFPIAEAGALVIAILFFVNLVKSDFKKLH